MTKLIDITGKALSGEWGVDDDTGNGTPVIRTTNFTYTGKIDYTNVITRAINKKNIAKKFLCKGDIIIEKSGGSDKFPVGRVVFFDGEENKYLFNNFTGLLRVKDKEKWFPKYVLYSLLSNYNRGGTRKFENKTTGLHNLKIDDYVNKCNIRDVDFNHQKDICNQLDKIDNIICKYKEEQYLLDELVKARFVEMFGDIISNDKNWNSKPLKELCDISRGASPRPISDYLGGTIPWIKIGDATIGDSIYINSTKEHIIKEGVRKSRFIKKGSLIFANCGVSLGFCRIINFDGCIHDGWLAFQNIDTSLNKIFLLTTINQMTGYFRKIAPGGTQPNLNTDIVGNYIQVVPPLELQNQFADFVKEVDKSRFIIKSMIKEGLL